MNQRGAARVGQQLAAQSDQAARGNLEIQPHTAGTVIAHLQHFAAAAANGFHDDADKILRDVDYQAFHRLHFPAVDGVHHDFRFANHQLKAFAPHGFDQDRQLQFAAAQHTERFRRVRIFHADGDVGKQLFSKPIAQVA